MSIPRIIHFVWLGPPMPDWAADNIRLFKELNPEFLCHVHGQEALLPILTPAFNSVSGEHVFARKSDVPVSGTNRISWFSGLPQLASAALVPVTAVSLMNERRSMDIARSGRPDSPPAPGAHCDNSRRSPSCARRSAARRSVQPYCRGRSHSRPARGCAAHG